LLTSTNTLTIQDLQNVSKEKLDINENIKNNKIISLENNLTKENVQNDSSKQKEDLQNVKPKGDKQNDSSNNIFSQTN
jgi:regulator of replication initiation timing